MPTSARERGDPPIEFDPPEEAAGPFVRAGFSRERLAQLVRRARSEQDGLLGNDAGLARAHQAAEAAKPLHHWASSHIEKVRELLKLLVANVQQRAKSERLKNHRAVARIVKSVADDILELTGGDLEFARLLQLELGVKTRPPNTHLARLIVELVRFIESLSEDALFTFAPSSRRVSKRPSSFRIVSNFVTACGIRRLQKSGGKFQYIVATGPVTLGDERRAVDPSLFTAAHVRRFYQDWKLRVEASKDSLPQRLETVDGQ